MGKVITVANAKGGVGKSSSSTALAAILTERGYRTLLIDCDIQCNSTDTYRANIMIIRSKEKVQVNGKNKPLWVLDTDALIVTHNTPDAEPNVTAFSLEHIKYHLNYSAEYRLDRLRKLVNSSNILDYLTNVDRFVAEMLERQIEKWKVADKEYLDALAVGDFHKAHGLENMLRLCAREPVLTVMVYV